MGFDGLLDAPAAIAMDHLTRHVVAVIRGEIGRGANDIFRVGHPLYLQFIAHDIFVGLTLFLLEPNIDEVLVQLFPQRGHNHAGGIAVDGDVVFGQTERTTMCQRVDAVF